MTMTVTIAIQTLPPLKTIQHAVWKIAATVVTAIIDIAMKVNL